MNESIRRCLYFSEHSYTCTYILRLQQYNPCLILGFIKKKRWEHLESLFLRFIIYAKQDKDKLSSNKKISRPPRKYITKVIYNY